MKYGKLNDGALIQAPSTLTIDGRVHYHPSSELYEIMGYLPIVDEPYPETDEENPKYYASSYIEQDGKIVKVWTETEPPAEVEPTPTLADRVTVLENELSVTQEAVDYLIMESEI